MSTREPPDIWEIVAQLADLVGALAATYALVTWARQGFRVSALGLTSIATLIGLLAVLYLAAQLAYTIQRRRWQKVPPASPPEKPLPTPPPAEPVERRRIDARGAQIGVIGDGAHIEGGIHFHTHTSPILLQCAYARLRWPWLRRGPRSYGQHRQPI